MTREELLARVEQLAGCQRDKSWRFAIDYAIHHEFLNFAETGCYRGTDGDGQSTVLLGMVACWVNGTLWSYEINPANIDLAKMKAKEYLHSIRFIQGDSVESLSRREEFLDLVYLDSYDFGADLPGPPQRHQLAEVGAVLGKLAKRCIVVLDDADLPHGGKTGLSAPFLEERGFQLRFSAYQKVYVRE